MKIPKSSNFLKLLGIFLVGCAPLSSSAFAAEAAEPAGVHVTDSDHVCTTQNFLVITISSSDNDVECAVLSLMNKDNVTITVVGVGSITAIACGMAEVATSKSPPPTKNDLMYIANALAYLASLVPDDKEAIINCVNKKGLETKLLFQAINKPLPLPIVVSPD